MQQQGGIPQVGMVIYQNEPAEWKVDSTTGARLGHRDRCFDAQLGSSLQQVGSGHGQKARTI